MKILIISNLFPPEIIGGAEMVAFNQAKELQRIGHEIRVITGKRNNVKQPHLVEVEQQTTGLVYRISLTTNEIVAESRNFDNPYVDILYEKVIHEFEPDVVHAHNLAGLSVNFPEIAQSSGAVTCATIHDFWAICPRNTLTNQIGLPCDHTNCQDLCLASYSDGENRVPIQRRNSYIQSKMLLCDNLISPSQFLASQFISAGYPRTKFKVISNGIHIENTRPQSNNRENFLFVGHLGWHKGLDNVIKALSMLPKTARSIYKLFVAGEGEETDKYIHLAHILGVSNEIVFLGKIDNNDVRELMKSSIALISGSRWPENQPVSILEAYASSTPVIAPNIGGVPELVMHNKNGLLYELNNVSDLMHQISHYIEEPDTVKRHGKHGYELVQQRHCISDTIKLLMKLYTKSSLKESRP